MTQATTTTTTTSINPRIYDPLSPWGAVEIAETKPENALISANSTPPLRQQAVYPLDSILDLFMRFAREYSESEDSMLLGAVLPLVGRLLARRVFIRFGGRKYPNLYSVLVTRPGFRKSTNIRLVETLGRALLPEDAFLNGATSEQALFAQYQLNADRFLIEEEGNTILSNWASDAAGKCVAKRFLRLYDCAGWQQAYLRHTAENGESLQSIAETSTSLLIGTTFNNCRFNGLETRDGMRRRVSYYLSEHLARTIYWPSDLDGAAFLALVEAFRPLTTLAGEVYLSSAAHELWRELQDRNRRDLQSVQGFDLASEAYSSALSEESSRILKFAMLFEACRCALDPTRNWPQLPHDTLALAAEHGRYCLAAGQEIDAIGRREEIRNQADAVLATIRMEWGRQASSGAIELTRTELTHRFAPNPGRANSLTPARLYREIIPDLERRNLARALPKTGKQQGYLFDAGKPAGGKK